MSEQPNTPSRFTISEAARWVSKDRKTIQRRIKVGKISTKEDTQGRTYIEPSELMREFGEDFKVPEGRDKVSQNGKKSQEVAESNTKLFEEKIKMLEARVEELKQDKQDFKAEKETAQKREEELITIIKQQMALLPAPKDTKKRGFFRWIGR